MVIRLEGRADGRALSFIHQVGDVWAANVPCDMEDGEYVVELTAWDDAGNSSYYATVLMIINAGQISIQLTRPVYAMSLQASGYVGMVLGDEYRTRLEVCACG